MVCDIPYIAIGACVFVLVIRARSLYRDLRVSPSVEKRRLCVCHNAVRLVFDTLAAFFSVPVIIITTHRVNPTRKELAKCQSKQNLYPCIQEGDQAHSLCYRLTPHLILIEQSFTALVNLILATLMCVFVLPLFVGVWRWPTFKWMLHDLSASSKWTKLFTVAYRAWHLVIVDLLYCIPLSLVFVGIMRIYSFVSRAKRITKHYSEKTEVHTLQPEEGADYRAALTTMKKRHEEGGPPSFSLYCSLVWIEIRNTFKE